MPRFWRRIAQLWHEFRNRRKYGAAIRPDSIRAQAEDLGHLAELAGRSGALAEAESRHLAQLGREMRSLALMGFVLRETLPARSRKFYARDEKQPDIPVCSPVEECVRYTIPRNPSPWQRALSVLSPLPGCRHLGM